MLNALALYLSKIYWRSCGRFSGVGAQGKVTGLSGGSSRLGHEHESEADVGTPEFEHAGRFEDVIGVIEAIGSSESH